jgi:hypothetical protein
VSSKFFTENVFFNNPLIAAGPCPSCSYENRIYFGDILGVEVRPAGGCGVAPVNTSDVN